MKTHFNILFFALLFSLGTRGGTLIEYSYESEVEIRKISSLNRISNKESVRYIKVEWSTKTKFPKQLLSFPNLKELVLMNCRLIEIPDEISEFKKLHRLEFITCAIQKISDSIGSLDSLEKLTITYSSFSSLPASCNKLVRLRELILRGNESLSFDTVIYFESLKKLELLNCKATKTLPYGIENLLELEWLAIGGTSINFEQELRRCENLKNLEYLDITYSELKEIPESIFKIQSLKDLNLRGNDFTYFPPEIRKLYNLKKLHLAFNQSEIKRSDRELLKEALPYCQIMY
ncbi:MAG: hypothetical protein RIE58_07835 [Vicingaceae bacterium]